MNWYQIPCKLLLSVAAPFAAVILWWSLRNLSVTYKMCLKEVMAEVWDEEA